MASWGSNNDIASAPTFVDGMVGYTKIATAYGNTAATANTVGNTLKLVSANTASGKGTQPGWVYTIRGTGNRLGRVHHEVLVALNSNSAVSGV